jgi:hypothetical protein
VVSEVSTSCKAATPTLIVNATQVYWRVPVVFVRPQSGIVGQVGDVIVNAVTGEMDVTSDLARAYFQNAVKIAGSHPPGDVIPNHA